MYIPGYVSGSYVRSFCTGLCNWIIHVWFIWVFVLSSYTWIVYCAHWAQCNSVFIHMCLTLCQYMCACGYICVAVCVLMYVSVLAPPACCLTVSSVHCGVWASGPASGPVRDWYLEHPLFKHLSTCFPFDQCLPFLLIFQITDACQGINYLDRCSVDSSTSCRVHQRDLGILPAFPANHPQSISKSTWLAHYQENNVELHCILTLTVSYLHTVYGRLASRSPPVVGKYQHQCQS